MGKIWRKYVDYGLFRSRIIQVYSYVKIILFKFSYIYNNFI